MPTPLDVLAAAARPVPAPARAARHVLLAGGGGALGSAVLERLLAAPGLARVGVLAEDALAPALRRLHTVAPDAAAMRRFAPDTALVVFDRARHANGREAAFVRPQPQALPELAAQLHAAGATALVVVVPHRAAMLPLALQSALATLDEHAVAALGWRQVVFMRTARAGDGPRAARWPQRLADGLLNQLSWMVPQSEQPVRSTTVARVAVALAQALPEVTPGTRVLAPQWLWQAAQTDAAGTRALLQRWLAGEPLPAGPRDRRRW